MEVFVGIRKYISDGHNLVITNSTDKLTGAKDIKAPQW